MELDSAPIQQSLSLKPSATAPSKLPVKRKISVSASSSLRPDSPFHPNPNFLSDVGSAKLPPFKFHRIWTQPDEIRFLQGLLASASDGLSFPRDLQFFYDRFSNAMSQPYTKSQLSDKLCRLRKKFRVISSRLSRGLDATMLSPHDQALYQLSKKLWSPEFASISPFVGNSSQRNANSGKIKVEDDAIGLNFCFSTSLPTSTATNQNERCGLVGINVDCEVDLQKQDRAGSGSGYCDGKIGLVVAKTVLDVFQESLKEAKMALLWPGILCADQKSFQSVSVSSSKEGNSVVNFGRRWQEQQALELDVFARRLRLLLENFLHEH